MVIVKSQDIIPLLNNYPRRIPYMQRKIKLCKLPTSILNRNRQQIVIRTDVLG